MTKYINEKTAKMIVNIFKELKDHSPYTFFGALTGILVALLCHKLPARTSYTVFYVLHPIHVFLSALVTSSMYELHRNRSKKSNLWILLLIGYVGSIGIATLSDSVIPFIAEWLLKMPKTDIHLGFIEKWWLVNPLAIAGVALAYYLPKTKFPHAGHVLLSIWASVFHILMATPGNMNFLTFLLIFIFLFLAVWLPCCLSDIVFPLLFSNENTLSREYGKASSRSIKSDQY